MARALAIVLKFVDFLEETDLEDRLDLQDALEAIAESERLGEQPIPCNSVVGELVYGK